METQIQTNDAKPKVGLPWQAWVIGCFLLLFGLFAVFDSVMSFWNKELYYKQSGMTLEQIAYYSAMPMWPSLSAAFCSWLCLAGSVALLFKFAISSTLYGLSAIGNFPFILYSYILSAGIEAMGMLWLMPLIMTSIIMFGAYYCRKLALKGNLR